MSYYENYWDRSVTKWNLGMISSDEQFLFSEFLKPGGKCLDYGCGPALRYGKFLQDKQVDYHGFDISKSAVEQAVHAGIHVEMMDEAGKTNLRDNSMDVAICLEVLEHLMEPGVALAEMLRCLKPGAPAVISVPNAGRWENRVEFFLTGFYSPGGSPDTSRREPWRDAHIRFYSAATFQRMARESGFNVEKLIGEKFSLAWLPVVYRIPFLHKTFGLLSKPFGFLGRVLPSLFSGRMFLIVRKPGHS